MITIESIYPYMEADLPGCPKPSILQAAVDTIIDFCEETQAWRCDLNPIHIVADQAIYDIWDAGAPSQSEIVLPVTVKVEDVEKFPGTGYTIPVKGQIELVATPTSAIANGLTVKVALRPKRTAEAVDSRLFDDWYRVWAHGIRARLMMQAKKPWTDLVGGRMEEIKYSDGRGKARIEVMRGAMNKPLQMRAKYKFA